MQICRSVIFWQGDREASTNSCIHRFHWGPRCMHTPLKGSIYALILSESLHLTLFSRAPVPEPIVNDEKVSSEDGVAITDTPSAVDGRPKWNLSLPAKELRPLLTFASDIYLCEHSLSRCTRIRISATSRLLLAYIFWSIFTSLIPTLFYFSVWELGIAGHELALLSTLSPVLLSSSHVLSWSRSRGGRTVLHALSFSGLAAYALKDPLHRLFVVSFANICGTLGQTVDWTGVDERGVGYQAVCELLYFLSC